MDANQPVTLPNDGAADIDVNVQRILRAMVPRFRRQFPVFRDQAHVADALDQAAKRIARKQRRVGALANLHGYAWVALRRVAASWLRTGPGKLEQRLQQTRSHQVVERLTARFGTVEEIECRVLARELLSRLTGEERRVCWLRNAGFSSGEIAQRCGMSTRAIDTLLSRARSRLRPLTERRTLPLLRARGRVDRKGTRYHPMRPHTRIWPSSPENCRSSTTPHAGLHEVVRTTVGHSRSSSSPLARPDGSPPADSPSPSRFV